MHNEAPTNDIRINEVLPSYRSLIPYSNIPTCNMWTKYLVWPMTFVSLIEENRKVTHKINQGRVFDESGQAILVKVCSCCLCMPKLRNTQ